MRRLKVRYPDMALGVVEAEFEIDPKDVVFVNPDTGALTVTSDDGALRLYVKSPSVVEVGAEGSTGDGG